MLFADPRNLVEKRNGTTIKEIVELSGEMIGSRTDS